MPPLTARRSLTTVDHDCDAVQMRYVYAVVSRRAGGVSVGVNLNTNSACNWRCVYCQVEGLTRGGAPPLDLALLERELGAMLDDIASGDFLARNVPDASQRVLRDVAFSGNGEPTSSPQFREAVEVVARCLRARGLAVPVVLITNGSLVHQARVREGLRALAAAGGEVWFKLDAATDEGIRRVNNVRVHAARHLERLAACAALAPTWVQSCFVARDGRAPDDAEVDAWVAALDAKVREGVPLRGVLMYSLARPSHQPEAPSLSAVDPAWLERLGARVRALGLTVRVSP